MPNSATIILIGHLGPKVELKYTPTGKAVLKFSLCVNTGYGENKVASWYNCALWGDRAAKLEPMLAKGKPVQVIGEPCVRQWSGKDGTKGTSVDINVRDVCLLGTREEGHAQPGTQEDAPQHLDETGQVPF